MLVALQYDPELLNSFDSNPKRHLSYGYAAGRNWREESLVDEEDAMLEYTALPWNAADVEATGVEACFCGSHMHQAAISRLGSQCDTSLEGHTAQAAQPALQGMLSVGARGKHWVQQQQRRSF